jgi:hypothetical protein
MVAPNPIPPTNVQNIDNINNVTSGNPSVTTNSSTGNQVTQSVSTQSSTTTQTVAQSNQTGGLNITPVQNPLNVYANYTYHIRFSLTDETTANNVTTGSYSSFNGISKVIIAESGVTAGFNITEYEFVNACSPGPNHLNTTSTTWSMTILEPYGMSLIDKLIASNRVQSWARAPYFIEVWFNGYNADGTVMSPTLFYTLYRVIILDIDVKVTEGGSVYKLTGAFDGDIGHSNEISIPAAKLTVTASTLKEFFINFATQLNLQASRIDYSPESVLPTTSINVTTPPLNTTSTIYYSFNVPTNMQGWTFRQGQQTDWTSQRAADMIITPNGGVTTFTISNGASIESIINAVIATCPDVNTWIGTNTGPNNAANISSTGVATWVKIHAVTVLGAFCTTPLNDYTRSVLYNIIPYTTTIVPTTNNLTAQLENTPGTQVTKLSNLASAGALTKVYDYIYTGLNTEVINFDISIDSAWQLSQPQWLALNNYSNSTQGPLMQSNSAMDQLIRAGYLNKPLNITSLQSDSGGTSYLEDQVTIGTSAVFTLVTRPINMPTAQRTDILSDANKACTISTPGDIPDSRAFVSNYLQQLTSNVPSFMIVDLEIRGDPYWMGLGNVDENVLAGQLGQGSSSNGANDPRAPFLSTSCMFILAFRTGTNYNPSTGIMVFDSTSALYNGAYMVMAVTNSFKHGSFTQTLNGAKDIFSQSITTTVTP